MKNHKYLLNILLAAVLCLGLAIAVLVRTFQPAAVMPELSIPNLTLLSLAVLLLDRFLAPAAKRDYALILALCAVTFTLLPLAAGMGSVKLAIGGSAVFTAVTWLFSTMTDRMESGCHTKTAAVASALGLYLAVQAFAGILL